MRHGAFSDIIGNIARDKTALACAAFIAVSVALCFCAPLIAPYPYEEQNLALGCSAPSAAPSISPGISAMTKLCPSSTLTKPKLGVMVVK